MNLKYKINFFLSFILPTGSIVYLAQKPPQTLEGSVKSSGAEISREKKTDANMESTPPPRRTRTERETERGAEIRAESGEVKEVIPLIAQVTHGQSRLNQALWHRLREFAFHHNARFGLNVALVMNKHMAERICSIFVYHVSLNRIRFGLTE